MWKAEPRQPHFRPRLDARRHLDPFRSFHGGYVKGGPQRGFCELYLPFHDKIVPLPGKERVAPHLDHQIEIPWRGASESFPSLSMDPQPRSGVHSRRHLDRQLLPIASPHERNPLFTTDVCLAEGDRQFHGEILTPALPAAEARPLKTAAEDPG